MAKLLASTAEITSEIEKLINDSQGEKLILITPYLRMARQFKDDIKDQENFKTNIAVIVRADESHDPADINFLQQELKGVNLYTHQNLHAKCYLNHKTAIITSMNLYEYSQLNNTELGIKVEKTEDPKLYDEINDAAKKIMRNSKEFAFEIKKVEKIKSGEQKQTDKTSEKPKKEKPESGYCIRCGEKISFNPNKPLCDRCYPIWAKFGDPGYVEKCCHICGKEDSKHERSYEKPICYTCYKKIYK
jgi:phosphatidylserine/phosphatidylglycerophosphate/cardiolipin synthase-like enzyme